MEGPEQCSAMTAVAADYDFFLSFADFASLILQLSYQSPELLSIVF